MTRERIYLSPPDVGAAERTAILAAFDSGWVAPVGPDLDQFEDEIAAFAGTAAAVGLSSGTAALHLALLTLGVEPGDDVLVSTFTFSATANAVVYVGANPVFIDSDDQTWNMSPELLEVELTSRARRNCLPKAVLVVDLYGQCADYDAIVPICERFGVPIIEDAAEAIGATWGGRPAGSFGQAGVFSFNGNKIMTTSGGGMLVTDDNAMANRARYLSTQARQPVAHYEHTELGFNYRMSNLLAALGRAQLSRLPAMIERRREIQAQYRRELESHGIRLMPTASRSEPNAWLSCVVFDSATAPDRVRYALEARNIEARPLWKPMHQQPFYATATRRLNGCSDRLFEHGLCLPSGSSMTTEQVAEVAAIVLEATYDTPREPTVDGSPDATMGASTSI